MFSKKPLNRGRLSKAKLMSKLHELGRTVRHRPVTFGKTSDDEDDVALVDTLPGDCSPPYQPTSLPTPVKTNVPNGSTKAEPPPAKAAMSEAKGPKTEITPSGRGPQTRSQRRSPTQEAKTASGNLEIRPKAFA